MKTIVAIAGLASVSAEQGSPIDKIITMIGDLESKIIKEGEDAHKVYAEFAEWCEDTSKDTMFEIKTGKQDVADFKAATEIRDKEEAVFAAEEKDLMETIDTLQR